MNRWLLLGVGAFLLWRSRQAAMQVTHEAAKAVAKATATESNGMPPDASFIVPAGDQQYAPINTSIYAQDPASVGVMPQRSLSDMFNEQQ